jgi:hypothetical protein
VKCLSTFFALLAALLATWAAAPAHAHKASDAYLTIDLRAEPATARWDIALRDLEQAIGLDADGNGEITWGELRARHGEIAAYAAARLTLTRGGSACRIEPGAQQVVEHGDGAYTVLALALHCPARTPADAPWLLNYRLFADTDPLHRGLLQLVSASGSQTLVLDPSAAAPYALDAGATGPWATLASYIGQGIWHIWIGLDHILFLVSLLLPAVLMRQGSGQARRWQAVPRFGDAFWDVLRVVTAFTVAHSITLALAALELVELPSRPVEAVIAASVVLAALNNVYPVIPGRRWAVAFVFGLVHGFGFAGALGELGLPPGAKALALLGFNVGVEIGQIAIVLVFLPLAYALRRSWFYRRAVLVGGSIVIALVAAAWFVERAFEIPVFPT